MRRTLHTAVLVALLAAGVVAARQLGGREPLPEHALYDRWLGTWEAIVTAEVPGAGEVESQGMERNRLGPGGRWLMTELQYKLLGTLYEGAGVLGYDPAKRAWVSSWVDSTDDALKLAEASWDADTSTMTLEREFLDASGHRVAERIVDHFLDANTRELVVYSAAGDQPEDVALRIRLRRH